MTKPSRFTSRKVREKRKKRFFIFIEKIPGEGQGEGYPAEIEQTGSDVEECIGVELPVFVGCEDNAVGAFDSEQGSFCMIEGGYMDGVVFIIGERLHRIEEDPEDDKYSKAQDEAPGRAGEIEEGIEQENEE